MILFLFVVMMLDIKHNQLKINRLHLPTGIVLGFFTFFYSKSFLINMFKTPYYQNEEIFRINKNVYVNWQLVLDQSSDVIVLSAIFYENFAFQILMAGVLLYTTTIGVVFLTANRGRNSFIKKKQSLTKQLSRTKIL